MNKFLLTTTAALLINGSLLAQYKKYTTTDSIKQSVVEWQHQDLDESKIAGVSSQRTYNELIKDQKPKKTIVVAVIDSGVDTDHEDLKDKMWINADEIPDNGIDDDKNGYIDDMYGWNFLGNSEGEMGEVESLEMTRVLRDFADKFEGKSQVDFSGDELFQFKSYQRAKTEHEKELKEKTQQQKMADEGFRNYEFSLKLLKIAMQKDDYTIEELEALEAQDRDLSRAKQMVLFFRKNDIESQFRFEHKYITNYVEKHLNTDYNGRVSKDDIYDFSDTNYGNNNVEGKHADHGTFVSSMIAAQRGNGLGVDGIAEAVQIMAIRAVPDGDEYDKDIALAIRYAVDNGANIINMSFGKAYSLYASEVKDAMHYASTKNVLLVHAAGNDGSNIDRKPNFPNDRTDEAKSFSSTWIEVGSNSKERKKELCSVFSNYGKKQVDIFAPGDRVVGCVPNDKYAVLDGTSFACPVTSGVAALVWSYYPELTAAELKDILMTSVSDFSKKKVNIPSSLEKKKKTKFKELCTSGGVVNAYNAFKAAQK